MSDFYSLSHFGWDECRIPTDLKNLCSYLPTYSSLKTLRSPQTIHGMEVYFPHKLFKKDGVKYMPAFVKGTQVDDGGYAQIYKGRRGVFKPVYADSTKDISGTTVTATASATATATTGATVSAKARGPLHLARDEPFTEICIKEVQLNITPDEDASSPESRMKIYHDEVNAILYEAFLHALLYTTLEREGFSSAVPKIYDIVALAHGVATVRDPTEFEAIWMSMEFIHGLTLERFLRKELKPVYARSSPAVYKRNETILLDVFVQLAYYLHILQEKLRFNHRDMKVNNIFVRTHDDTEAWHQTLTIPSIGSWRCTNDIVLIDFGFSCIACGSGFLNPRATLVGAGSWFKPEHDCLKYGRDLAQFLYSLHCAFPLQDYISAPFFNILHEALCLEKDGRPVDLMMGVDTAGNPIGGTVLPKTIKFNEGIYKFLRTTGVDALKCRPYTFLKALSSLIAS